MSDIAPREPNERSRPGPLAGVGGQSFGTCLSEPGELTDAENAVRHLHAARSRACARAPRQLTFPGVGHRVRLDGHPVERAAVLGLGTGLLLRDL
ncbi:hypothetical protein ACWEQL_13135 [Kitasatospora sp. NPDC004240]